MTKQRSVKRIKLAELWGVGLVMRMKPDDSIREVHLERKEDSGCRAG